MTSSTLSPSSGPIKLNPALPGRPAPATLPDPERAAADARHRAHCRVCQAPDAAAMTGDEILAVEVPGPGAYTAALVAVHAPDARLDPARPQLRTLVTGKGRRR